MSQVSQAPKRGRRRVALRLIAGVIRPDAGRIVRNNVRRTGDTCALVPQRGGLYRELELKENLKLYAGLYGKKETGLDRAQHVRAMGLVPLLNKRFSELSGGFQRLAVIAAAMHVAPDRLLVDEPLSGLDPGYVTSVREHLAVFRSPARLLVITSQHGSQFPDADRVIRIEGGRLA